MNTHETYVSLETAKLLKQAGFDWDCRFAFLPTTERGETPYAYFHKSTNYNDKIKYPYEVYSAPTLEVVQRWLRDTKSILLYIVPKRVDRKWKWDFWYIDLRDVSDIEQRYSIQTFSTYEEAQEAGIKKALELILEEGK